MTNIIQCRARAESCDSGDGAESRRRAGGEGGAQAQQQAPGADQATGTGPEQSQGTGAAGEDGCPLTSGGGGGGGEGSAGGAGQTAAAQSGGEGGHGPAQTSAAGGEGGGQAANDAAASCGPQGEEAEQGRGGGGGSPPPPPVQTLGVETPKPLGEVVAAEATLTLAPTLAQLTLAGLGFPQGQTEENAATQEQVIRDVRNAYGGVRHEAEALLERHRAAGAAAIAAIGESFAAVDEEMRADHLRLDDRLVVRHDGLVVDLHHHRDAALRRLAGGRGGARMAIFRARNAGTQALQRKLDTTGARITEIVELAILPYRQILDGAVSATRTEIDSALTTMTSWQSGIEGRFPLFADTRMQGAANEGKRETAHCRVDEELPKLRCRGQQLTSTFAALIAPFEQHARQGLEPTMQAEGERARRCGFSAIQEAADRSVEAVDQSWAAGRDWIKSQAAASERQLIQMLNAARAALRDQVEAKRNHLRQEAEQGRGRLTETHENQQTGIADALTSYRDSILGAAPSGQSTFRSTGTDGAGETRKTFAELAARFRDGSEEIEEGARTGLETGHALFSEEAGATVDRQQFAAWEALAEARGRTDDGVGERIGGMYRLKTGVEQTANQWSMDYAERFSDLIDQTWEQIDQCEPVFQGRVDAKRDEVGGWVRQRQDPDALFRPDLDEVAENVLKNVEKRSGDLEDELEDTFVDDKTVVAAIRGVTWAQGRAVSEHYEQLGGSLISDIIEGTSGDDQDAALAYLRGDQAEGAEYELKASVHWYNDDEQRIRDTLRSLDDEQLRAFIDRPGAASTIASIRGNLGGVDRDVFDTLIRTDFPNNETRLAHADAQDLQDRLSHAHNREEMNRELTSFYSNAEARGYGSQVSNDELRRLINDRMAHVRNVTDNDGNIVSGEAADRVVQGLVDQRAEQLDRMRCGHPDCAARYQGTYGDRIRRQRGAEADLSTALITHGVGSTNERIARLGIEITRGGGARMENVDQNLVDPRLNPEPPELEPSRYPDGQVPAEVRQRIEQQRAQALAERERLLSAVAERYGDAQSGAAGNTAAQVTDLLGRGQGQLGQRVIRGLVTDPFPSARTTSLILEYSAAGAGTNEALMKQATERLNRGQIAAAAEDYAGRHPGESLWSLVASETSGQDFLDMERAWLGNPRNARERAEVALFVAHQQRREAGDLGASLVEGSRTERRFRADEDRLRGLVGGSISFSRRGEPPQVTIRNGNFDEMGRYIGKDEVALNVAAAATRASAERYAKNIDEWASAITTTIAIIGAVIATVVTGGGASPLLAMAIAGAIGGASMLANHMIRGGRYGWEEALTDLGMTAVSMLTAGLGQRLQAMKAIQAMGKLEQAVVPAMITGGIDSLGQTALNEATWQNGIGEGIGEVLIGTIRGGMTASVAALGTQGIQRLGRAGRTIGDIAGESTNTFARSAAQAVSSGAGAFVSRGAELGFESLRGKYRGDAGDIFVEMGKSAGQAALQGIGEGAGEAWRDRNRIAFGLYTRPGWMDPGEYQALRDAFYGSETSAGPNAGPDTGSGTAAGIAGSRFRGDVNDSPTVRDTDVHGALADLTGDRGPLQGRVRPDEGGAADRAVIDLGDGGAVEVRFKVVDDMAAVNGEVPVARFDRLPEGGFEVKVSSRADPELVGRALAHELTEIRALQRPDAAERVADGDLLRPGTARRFDADLPPKLSPHDQGRIAEADWLARQIAAEQARTPPDSARVNRLNEEMHSLLAHLGVVGEGQGATRRREAMLEHLPDPRLRGAIEAGAQGAAENPRLRHQGIDHEAALRDLTERWQRAIAVGDEGTAQGLLRLIHRTLMRMERVRTDQRLTRKQQQRMEDGAADRIGDPRLVAAMHDLLRTESQIKEGHLRHDPAAADPDGAQAVRREFADRPHFQDWPEFRQKYFETFSTRNPNDPVDINRAYYDWASGAYVSTDSGRLRSVVSGVRRPDPGFEARWLGGVRPHPERVAHLDPAAALVHDLGGVKALVDLGMVRSGDLSPELQRQIDGIAGVERPTTSTVGEAAELRHRLLEEARRIDERRQQPGLDPDEALRLRELHHALEHQAIRLAEALGEAAAHRVAREVVPGDWEPVHFPGAGAGLPDVVYRNRETGQLLIVEAKGGTSGLGVRRDVHGRVLVEQGTRAYLESLAAEMRRSDTKAVRDLGAEIARRLAEPDGIDYRVVRQPFDKATGRPLTPEVGRFDLGPPPATAEQGHRSAAPVPGSRFHGEALRPGRAIAPRQLHGAARALADTGGMGVPRLVVDAGGGYLLRHPDGREVSICLQPVPPERLGTDPAGRRNNAEWDFDPDGPADFVIWISERTDPDQLARALAHDLAEVGGVAFEGGATSQPRATNEHGLDLSSPHGRGRLAEVQWLARQIGAGDHQGVHARELDALLRHLGVDDPSRPGPRQDALLAALAEQDLLTPEVRQALGVADEVPPTASSPPQRLGPPALAEAPAAPKMLPSGTIGPERQLPAPTIETLVSAELDLPYQRNLAGVRRAAAEAAIAHDADQVRALWDAPTDGAFEQGLTRLVDELRAAGKLDDRQAGHLRDLMMEARLRRTAEAQGLDVQAEAATRLAEAQARGDIDPTEAAEIAALLPDSFYAARQFRTMDPRRFVEIYRGFKASGQRSLYGYLEGRGGRMRTEERALLGELTAQSVLGERGHTVLGGRDGELPPQRTFIGEPGGGIRVEPTGRGTGISEVKRPGIDIISVDSSGVPHLVDNKAYDRSSGAIGAKRLESVFVKNIVGNLEAELPRLRQLAAELAGGAAAPADPSVRQGLASDQQIVDAVARLDDALTALKAAEPLTDLAQVVAILDRHGVKLAVMTEMGSAPVSGDLADLGIEHIE